MSKIKVRCQVTGEYGTADSFYHAPDKHYYKTKEIYENKIKESEARKQIIDTICFDFLDYQKGQVFPKVLTSKLKELSFYSNQTILKTIKECRENIIYWMNKKDFDSDYGKISYIFAIIKNKINDVYREEQRQKRQESKAKEALENQIINDVDIANISVHHDTKDISKWLEEDE